MKAHRTFFRFASQKNSEKRLIHHFSISEFFGPSRQEPPDGDREERLQQIRSFLDNQDREAVGAALVGRLPGAERARFDQVHPGKIQDIRQFLSNHRPDDVEHVIGRWYLDAFANGLNGLSNTEIRDIAERFDASINQRFASTPQEHIQHVQQKLDAEWQRNGEQSLRILLGPDDAFIALYPRLSERNRAFFRDYFNKILNRFGYNVVEVQSSGSVDLKLTKFREDGAGRPNDQVERPEDVTQEHENNRALRDILSRQAPNLVGSETYALYTRENARRINTLPTQEIRTVLRDIAAAQLKDLTEERKQEIKNDFQKLGEYLSQSTKNRQFFIFYRELSPSHRQVYLEALNEQVKPFGVQFEEIRLLNGEIELLKKTPGGTPSEGRPGEGSRPETATPLLDSSKLPDALKDQPEWVKIIYQVAVELLNFVRQRNTLTTVSIEALKKELGTLRSQHGAICSSADFGQHRGKQAQALALERKIQELEEKVRKQEQFMDARDNYLTGRYPGSIYTPHAGTPRDDNRRFPYVARGNSVLQRGPGSVPAPQFRMGPGERPFDFDAEIRMLLSDKRALDEKLSLAKRDYAVLEREYNQRRSQRKFIPQLMMDGGKEKYAEIENLKNQIRQVDEHLAEIRRQRGNPSHT